MILIIDTLNKNIRVGYEELHLPTGDFSWIPSNVYQVRWYDTQGQIQYFADKKEGILIEPLSDLGIYEKAIEMFNDEKQRLEDEKKVQEELIEASRDYWQELRDTRNTKLAESDWTQISDSPLTENQQDSWKIYRQELRDLPGNTTDPKNPVWPLEPGA